MKNAFKVVLLFAVVLAINCGVIASVNSVMSAGKTRDKEVSAVRTTDSLVGLAPADYLANNRYEKATSDLKLADTKPTLTQFNIKKFLAEMDYSLYGIRVSVGVYKEGMGYEAVKNGIGVKLDRELDSRNGRAKTILEINSRNETPVPRAFLSKALTQFVADTDWVNWHEGSRAIAVNGNCSFEIKSAGKEYLITFEQYDTKLGDDPEVCSYSVVSE